MGGGAVALKGGKRRHVWDAKCGGRQEGGLMPDTRVVLLKIEAFHYFPNLFEL